MNEDITAMQEALTALRAELDEMRGKMKKMEQVILLEEVDGRLSATVLCSALMIRRMDETRSTAVHLGVGEIGGFVSVLYNSESEPGLTRSAVNICVENDVPHLRLLGKDGKSRADTLIQNDHGVSAVFSPGGKPGALMRAMAEGGSVAVLQPDGKPRAMLVHDENTSKKMGDGPRTELTFALPDGQHLMKLQADAGGGSIQMGPPGHTDAAVLVGREGMGSVFLRGGGEGTTVALLATEGAAQITAMHGDEPGAASEASLLVSKVHSGVRLHRPDGGKAVDLSVQETATTLDFLNESGESAVEMGHYAGQFSSLSLTGVPGNEGVRMIAGKEMSDVEVVSPDDPDTKVVCMVKGGKPVVMVRQENHALALMGEVNGAGTVCVYGPTPETAGIACLNGGPVAGSLSLSQPDGTQLLTLDGTDEGGRLMINNDLGFQRIAMGVAQESAGLMMNYTGNQGVQLAATPGGGALIVCDAEGNRRCSVPPGIEDE